MLHKITIFFETLQRIKLRQYTYRLFYSVRSTSFGQILFNINKSNKKKKIDSKIVCDYDLFFNYFDHYKKVISMNMHLENRNLEVVKNNKLYFLNVGAILDIKKWNYKDKSILWNYQLNYLTWVVDLLYVDILSNKNQNFYFIVNVLNNWIKYKSKLSLKPYPTSIRLFT